MFDPIFKFFRELDRRIKLLCLFLGIHAWSGSLAVQYNQLYATAIGATPIELGSLNSIGSITSSIISIPCGWIADRYGVKKVMLIGLIFTAVVSAIYGLAGNWWMLIPAFLLSGASQRLVMPFADILFVNIAKPRQRAMIMSFARTLWAIPRIFSPMLAALIITYFGGLNASGIRPLYYIQLTLGAFVLISIALWLKVPPPIPVEKKAAEERGSFTQDLRDTFKGEKWLKRFLFARVTRDFGMRLSASFVPLWIVSVKGANPYILGAMGTAGTIVSILLQIPAGRLADKIGRKKAFYLFRPFTYLGTLLMIMAPGPEYLTLVGVLGAIGLGGGPGAGLGGLSHVPFITMENEMVPEEKRGRWMGILGSISIVSFPASILGGFLWQQGLMIEVLLIPILLEVLITLPILHTIPDTSARVHAHA